MLANLHIVITLIAALTVTVLSLFQEISFYEVCIRLLIVIPIFYIFGRLIRIYIIKSLYPNDRALDDEEFLDEPDKETDSDDDFESDVDLEPQYVSNKDSYNQIHTEDNQDSFEGDQDSHDSGEDSADFSTVDSD